MIGTGAALELSDLITSRSCPLLHDVGRPPLPRTSSPAPLSPDRPVGSLFARPAAWHRSTLDFRCDLSLVLEHWFDVICLRIFSLVVALLLWFLLFFSNLLAFFFVACGILESCWFWWMHMRSHMFIGNLHLGNDYSGSEAYVQTCKWAYFFWMRIRA
jgi:hypothetical protein